MIIDNVRLSVRRKQTGREERHKKFVVSYSTFILLNTMKHIQACQIKISTELTRKHYVFETRSTLLLIINNYHERYNKVGRYEIPYEYSNQIPVYLSLMKK